jgi:hypothetical protein
MTPSSELFRDYCKVFKIIKNFNIEAKNGVVHYFAIKGVINLFDIKWDNVGLKTALSILLEYNVKIQIEVLYSLIFEGPLSREHKWMTKAMLNSPKKPRHKLKN